MSRYVTLRQVTSRYATLRHVTPYLKHRPYARLSLVLGNKNMLFMVTDGRFTAFCRFRTCWRIVQQSLSWQANRSNTHIQNLQNSNCNLQIMWVNTSFLISRYKSVSVTLNCTYSVEARWWNEASCIIVNIKNNDTVKQSNMKFYSLTKITFLSLYFCIVCVVVKDAECVCSPRANERVWTETCLLTRGCSSAAARTFSDLRVCLWFLMEECVFCAAVNGGGAVWVWVVHLSARPFVAQPQMWRRPPRGSEQHLVTTNCFLSLLKLSRCQAGILPPRTACSNTRTHNTSFQGTWKAFFF